MKRAIACIFVLLLLAGCATQDSRQSTVAGDPLNKFIGDWGLTVFAMGGGNFATIRCGEGGGPTGAVVTIAPPTESAISFAVICDEGSEYVFRLKGDAPKHTYLVTVKSKEGISINEFPVTYTEGQGWKGVSDQILNGKTVSITATIAPIEGRKWYGWMIAVQPTADIGREETPYLRIDLTRRK